MKYARIVQAIADTEWAITENKLNAIVDFIQLKAEGGSISTEDLQQFADAKPPSLTAVVSGTTGPGASENGSTRGNKIAVLPVRGTISHRMNMLSTFSGGVSAEELGTVIDSVVADSSIGTLVLDIDSPGGTVTGVQEVSAKVFEARERIRVVAIANGLAASAAYNIASQAHEISVIPSGLVGSIGVLSIHQSKESSDEKAGMKTTIIRAGKFKGEGNPFEDLSDEAVAAIQARVDERYDVFVADVARGRGVNESVVRNGFGNGRVVTAIEAEKLGMVDRIETLEQVIARLQEPETSDLRKLNPVTVTHHEEKRMSVRISREHLSEEEATELDRLEMLNSNNDAGLEESLSPLNEDVLAALPKEVIEQLSALEVVATTARDSAAAAQVTAQEANDRANSEHAARLTREMRDEAVSLFPNLPGTPKEKGAMLQSIRELPEVEASAIVTRLISGDAAIYTLLTTEQGHGRGGHGSAFSEIEALASKLMDDDSSLTRSAAITKVAKSNKELYVRYQEERGA